MPLIGITASTGQAARPYAASVEKRGATIRLLLPRDGAGAGEVLSDLDALLLTGGPDLDPSYYGEPPDPQADLELSPRRDAWEMALLREALRQDFPILCICRGMQLLNVALGGRLLQDLPGHKAERPDGRWESARHQVYVSPGSKLAAVIGMGGFFRVNSRHHQGLREAQRSPRLLPTAYSVEDGLLEGLELPGEGWVIGVQWHPEREEECPPAFGRLFQAFVERAAAQGARRAPQVS